VRVVLAGVRSHDQQAEVSLIERLRHHRGALIGPPLQCDITENATQLRPSRFAWVLPFARSQGFVDNKRPRVMFKVHGVRQQVGCDVRIVPAEQRLELCIESFENRVLQRPVIGGSSRCDNEGRKEHRK